MADLDAETIAIHDEVSNQFVAPSLNNQFIILVPMLEQVEVEWESTYTSEDQELAPVNRRIAGSEILSMILRILLFSVRLYFLRRLCVLTVVLSCFSRSGSLIRSFPMADVPYQWKARICGSFVLNNQRQSQVPVLVCVVSDLTIGGA